MFKDKRIIIAVAAIVLIVIGGFYMMSSKKSKTADKEPTFADQTIPTLKPEDIGLTMELSGNNRQVRFVIDKTDDIEKIEYEITYDADNPEARGGDGEVPDRTPRGFGGEETLSDSGPFESKFFDLGTCSSGTCRYDTGVEEIKLLVKVTKKDGKVYQVEDSIKL